MKKLSIWTVLCFLCCCVSLFTAAAAQQSVAHLEECTPWNFQNGELGTTNICDQPVAIQFMWQGDQHAVGAIVKPNERFDSGVSRGDGVRVANSPRWWMFAACPMGYVSSVTFVAANRETIVPGKYRCVMK